MISLFQEVFIFVTIPKISEFKVIISSVVNYVICMFQTLGESKIASMVESKDFRKGIIQLEW